MPEKGRAKGIAVKQKGVDAMAGVCRDNVATLPRQSRALQNTLGIINCGCKDLNYGSGASQDNSWVATSMSW